MWLDDNFKTKTVRFRTDKFSCVRSNKMIRRTDSQPARQTEKPEVRFRTQCAIFIRRTSPDKKTVHDKPICGF